jgi:hypothetical protein
LLGLRTVEDVPSPKVQLHDVGVLVDVSVKFT